MYDRLAKEEKLDLARELIDRHNHGLEFRGSELGGERGGSVVECRTPEREVGGSKPTAAVLCP